MVYLPVSHVTLGDGEKSRASRLSAIVAWSVGFFGILGAARRVAAAVETGHTPQRADLRALGIKGDLPKVR